jgi:hypothetical protein
MSNPSANVSLPEGVSLKRVAEVLLDAWEVGSHQWEGSPLQLKDGHAGHPPPPLPRDALDLFRVLHEAEVPYLLVGGIAMLTYVEGRNTKDVDLLMSVGAMERVPELNLLSREGFFVRGRFRSVQVDLLLTTNPLFKTVEQRFATQHRFAELEVPVSTVEGLILLKLYALPSLCRQLDWDRVYVYESDVKQLLARYHPDVEPLLALLEPHVLAGDLLELRKFINEEQERRRRAGEATG